MFDVDVNVFAFALIFTWTHCQTPSGSHCGALCVGLHAETKDRRRRPFIALLSHHITTDLEVISEDIIRDLLNRSLLAYVNTAG